MIYILPLYLFWKARSRTCQIIVYTPLLVSLSKLGNVLYTIGKVFWCSSSAMEIMWIGPWEAEIFKEQVWRRSLEEINLGTGVCIWGSAIKCWWRRFKSELDNTGSYWSRRENYLPRNHYQNRFLSTSLPIFPLSPHPPNRFWSNFISHYQGASNNVAYKRNNQDSTKEYSNYWEGPCWIKLGLLVPS